MKVGRSIRGKINDGEVWFEEEMRKNECNFGNMMVSMFERWWDLMDLIVINGKRCEVGYFFFRVGVDCEVEVYWRDCVGNMNKGEKRRKEKIGIVIGMEWNIGV